MLENFKKVDNPLTIIALFCALSEVAMAGTAVADTVWGKSETSSIFIWFVVGFPVLLLACFFLTLNWNHKVLYAPSDFRTDQAFLDLARREALKQLDAIDSELVEIIDKVDAGLPSESIQAGSSESPVSSQEVGKLREDVKKAREIIERVPTRRRNLSQSAMIVLRLLGNSGTAMTLEEIEEQAFKGFPSGSGRRLAESGIAELLPELIRSESGSSRGPFSITVDGMLTLVTKS